MKAIIFFFFLMWKGQVSYLNPILYYIFRWKKKIAVFVKIKWKSFFFGTGILVSHPPHHLILFSALTFKFF